MVRVITQETYDELVKENIEEFDMTPDEAIQEATAQFEAQGVDLSNIIKDLALNGNEDHLVTATVNKLKDLYSNNNDESILKELAVLRAECKKDLAHRVRAGKDGAYKILIDLLDMKQKKYLTNKTEETIKFLLAILNTLISLMDCQPDLLDQKGVELIKEILDSVDNEEIQIATLKWTAACCLKHEMNRQKLFAKSISNNLKYLLKTTTNTKVISEGLRVIRRLTLDDDIRVEFGKAHEHAREMGAQMLDLLTKLMEEHAKSPIVSDIMSTTASLLVRHELCAMAADAGACAVLFSVLADNYDNVAVSQQAIKLITALAGNDDVKRQLVNSGIVPVVVSLLSRHSSNAAASALTLKCIAALALREPEHGRRLLEAGAPDAVVECMHAHRAHPALQKNACWAIRNMVSRCREHNARLLELGVEELLNGLLHRHGEEFDFDVRSALRDLGCEVHFREQWTGRGRGIDA